MLLMLKSSYLLTCPTGKELTLVMLPSGKLKIQCNGNTQLMVNVCMCACLHVSVQCVVCKSVCNGTFTPWSAWLANVIDGASTICQT